jgi:hypothetical protein
VEALRVQAELKREERRLRRPLYAEAEDVLRQLPKLGIPMIMRRIERGENNGKAKIWSYPGMEKVVQQMRKKIDGVSELFTLDACRHGGMTELEEAELTDGQGRALSGHKTAQAYRGYAKETMQRALGCDPQATCASAGAEAIRTAGQRCSCNSGSTNRRRRSSSERFVTRLTFSYRGHHSRLT